VRNVTQFSAEFEISRLSILEPVVRAKETG